MHPLGAIFPSFIAGFIYIFTPGPIFLSMLSLVSSKGKKSGFVLASGAFAGDVLWLLLTYFFLIGSNHVPTGFTFCLNIACGGYLLWLAWKMIRSLKNKGTSHAFERPFHQGIMLGLLNPKSYPVSISMFSALLASHREDLSWQALPVLMLSAALGMVIAYTLEIILADIPHFRRFYQRHSEIFTMVFAIVFALFGLNLWYHAW